MSLKRSREPNGKNRTGALAWALALLLPVCSVTAAAQGSSAEKMAVASASAVASAPSLTPALSVELRRTSQGERVFVTLPAGTAAFAPQVTLQQTAQGREAWLELPFAAAAVRGSLGPSVPAYAVEGRRLSLTLGPKTSGLKAQFWPAVGGWPPSLLLDVVPATDSLGASAAAAGTLPNIGSNTAPKSAAPQPAPVAPIVPPKTGPIQARVVLDPGHGGIDPGMTSRWVREADVNLDVALRAARELEAHGVAVTLTRRSDTHLHPDKGTDLNLRSRMATTGQVSAFVSIHVNASTSPAAQGIETYYFGQPLPGQGRSLAVRENGGGSVGETLTAQASASAQGVLGDLLSQAKLSFSRRLAGLVQAELVATSAAPNRGVKTDAFYVIRSPTTPAILTELGFGSNPTEGQRLANPAYRQRQAEAIARALLRFLNTG